MEFTRPPVYEYTDEDYHNNAFFQPRVFFGTAIYFCKNCGVAVWDEHLVIGESIRSSRNYHTRAFRHDVSHRLSGK